MFKEGDWVKPAYSMTRLSGIDVENIHDMQVTKVYIHNREIECLMNITNGRSLRATFSWEYVVFTSGKEEYSLTF